MIMRKAVYVKARNHKFENTVIESTGGFVYIIALTICLHSTKLTRYFVVM